MTQVLFNATTGQFVNYTAERVQAWCDATPGVIGGARVWAGSNSAPDAAGGYAGVLNSWDSCCVEFGTVGVPFVATLVGIDGRRWAFVPTEVTRIEYLPGDTQTRVTWGAGDASAYAIIAANFATVCGALAFSPAAPTPFTLSAPCRINLPTPALVYSQACAVFCQKNIPVRSKAGVVFDSAAPCQLNAQLRELGSATIVARFDEAAPSSGERVIADTAYSGITVGWYLLEGINTGATGAAGFLLGMQVTE